MFRLRNKKISFSLVTLIWGPAHKFVILYFYEISATLESLLQQENIVIEFWTVKKKKLEQCHQYVLFEQSAKQVCFCTLGSSLTGVTALWSLSKTHLS